VTDKLLENGRNISSNRQNICILPFFCRLHAPFLSEISETKTNTMTQNRTYPGYEHFKGYMGVYGSA
jgi:hypothetical protein